MRRVFTAPHGGEMALVIVDPETVRELAETLARLNSQTRWKTGVPLAVAEEVLPHARALLAFKSLQQSVVPAAEPERDDGWPVTRSWISTKEAAEMLGITDRAVRKRIATGNVRARHVGPQWLIDPEELTA